MTNNLEFMLVRTNVGWPTGEVVLFIKLPQHKLLWEFKNYMLIFLEKRKPLGQPGQALEGQPVKSFFDFIGRTEATRGASR